MMHRSLCFGTALALFLMATSASAEPGKPRLIVRGAFRFDNETGTHRFNKDLSGLLRRLVSTQVGGTMEVVDDSSATACGALPESAQPDCYAATIKDRAWATVEVVVDPGQLKDEDGKRVERVPLRMYLFAPQPASRPGSASDTKPGAEALLRYPTSVDCALGPYSNDCESFIREVLVLGLGNRQPPLCQPATSGRPRKIAGGVLLGVGIGAAIGGGVLLGMGLQERGIPGTCDNGMSDYCIGYSPEQIGGGAGLLGAGALGIGAGLSLLLTSPVSRSSGDGTCRTR